MDLATNYLGMTLKNPLVPSASPLSCSLLMEKGPQQLKLLLGGLEQWMKRQGFDSISDVRGRLSQLNVDDPAGFERCNYLQVLESFSPGSGRQPDEL